MKQPDAVRTRLETTWRRNWTSWLGGGGSWPLTVSLEPPTEARARSQWPHFQAWVREWASPEWADRVVFAPRAWPHLGPQEVPTHVRLQDPAAVADALGAATRALWAVSEKRWAERVAAWPDLADELRAIAGWLGALEQADYLRFVSAFEWLASHPDSGLYMRQLPIAGLDSKWVESHAGPLARLLAVRLGRTPGPLAAVAGLATDVTRRRLRLLDPALRQHVCGLSDLQVRVDELGQLALPIRVAVVVENQQTALACGDLPGAVLLMGGGFAVTELGRLPWLQQVPLVYWGDIDTAGFAILAALRAWHPHTVSCLMDEATLVGHQSLWSHEDKATSARLECLANDEQALYQDLLRSRWGPSVRLEQERLDWPTAWAALTAATQAACTAPPPGRI